MRAAPGIDDPRPETRTEKTGEEVILRTALFCAMGVELQALDTLETEPSIIVTPSTR
jgi:hypothetical protein